MSAETNALPSSGLILAQAGAHGETVAETVQGTVDHGESGGMPPFLRFDPGVWIWTMVCFVLLLLILRKMAWKPIIASIEERDKTIKDSLDQAARIQSESLRIADEQAKILAAARSEAHALLQSTRQAGEDLKKKLEQTANEEKARILASAHTEIEAQKRAAIADLRKTTADLSIRIAEKLIQGSLDDAKQRALVDNLINEVSASAASAGKA